MTRETRILGCIYRLFVFFGGLIFLAGMGINIVWFLYSKLRIEFGNFPLFDLYISNLLPGLLLIAIAIFSSYFARRRWQQFLAFGVGGSCIALSFFWAATMNIGTFILVPAFSSTTNKEGPTSGNTPQEMFRYSLYDPIPSSVSNLEGVGDSWQGHSIYLRSQASKSDIDLLIASGYKPVKCSAIADRFVLPKGYNRFKPSWNPNLSSSKQCYEATNVKNGWASGDFNYLAINRKSGTVYFYGIKA